MFETLLVYLQNHPKVFGVPGIKSTVAPITFSVALIIFFIVLFCDATNGVVALQTEGDVYGLNKYLATDC
jgi:hypothetical protein